MVWLPIRRYNKVIRLMDLVRNAMPGWRSPLHEAELDERAGLERLPREPVALLGLRGSNPFPGARIF